MSRRAGFLALAVLLALVAIAGGLPTAAAETRPPDPTNDTIGWEDGYWYNESIPINQTDGLSLAERRALVARTKARVESIRGLEFLENVTVTVRSRDAFRREAANRSVNATLRTFDNVKFEALFLVNRSADSVSVQHRNTGASTQGAYDPGTKDIVLIAANASSVTLDEGTLAHELVHALQDQHFNLSRYRARTRDARNAELGLIEGDARYVEYLYTTRRCGDPDHPWNGTCVSPPTAGASGRGPPNLGVYFLTYQPYSDGPKFIRSIKSRSGWEAVNALYEVPPESAEQVIHPDRYPEETPNPVSLSDRTNDSWERVRPPGRPDYAQLGQTGVAAMIVYPLYHSAGGTRPVAPAAWLNRTSAGRISRFDPLNYGVGPADGWNGDRLHVYRNDANDTAYVWRLSWESAADTEEFTAAYETVLAYWGGRAIDPNTFVIERGGFTGAYHVARSNETVTITRAPTVRELPDVRRDIDLDAGTPRDDLAGLPRDASNPDGRSGNPGSPGVSTPGQAGFGVVVALIGFVLALRYGVGKY